MLTAKNQTHRTTRHRPFHLTGLILTALLVTVTPSSLRAMDVRNDNGGSINARFDQMRSLSAQGTQVRIVGTCLSACTMLLGLPNVCVSPNARLGFHGPSTRMKGIPLPYEEFERISYQMAAQYPEPLRRWFLAEGRMRTEDIYVLSGRQVIAMGARPCR